MKTTAEISPTLLDKARKLASQDGTTLRALVEEGLRRIIAERRHAGAFRLRKVTFKGIGLHAGLAGVPWERIRDLAHEGGSG
jgi:hypothetical protein